MSNMEVGLVALISLVSLVNLVSLAGGEFTSGKESSDFQAEIETGGASFAQDNLEDKNK